LNSLNGRQHNPKSDVNNGCLGNLYHRNNLQIHQNDPNGELANPSSSLHTESDNDGLDELREEVVRIFNAQKILVGPEDSGKSSLINAFNMILHLSNRTYH
jgi:polynucleotide 5'-kinase involved in rRNA processing